MNATFVSSYYQSGPQQPSQPVVPNFRDFLSYIPKDYINDFMALEKSLDEMCIEELWVRYGCVLKMKEITQQKLREMNSKTPIQKQLMIQKLVGILDREYYAVNNQMWRRHYGH